MNPPPFADDETSIMRQARPLPTQLIRFRAEKEAAERLLAEVRALGRDEQLLFVLTEPRCATEAFIYAALDRTRDELLAAKPEALELAGLAVLAAHRSSGPSSSAPGRLRLILEALALEAQAELAFGSRTRAEHLLWEALALSVSSDAEPLATIEFQMATALSSFAHGRFDDTLTFLRMAGKVAAMIEDAEIDAQILIVAGRMYELSGDSASAASSFTTATSLCQGSPAESHWLQVLSIIYLRAARVGREEVQ